MDRSFLAGKQTFCPECRAKPKSVGNITRIDYHHELTSHEFFDDDGQHHAHTDNHDAAVFTCMNGHIWQQEFAPPCPAGCDCSLTHQMREQK